MSETWLFDPIVLPLFIYRDSKLDQLVGLVSFLFPGLQCLVSKFETRLL